MVGAGRVELPIAGRGWSHITHAGFFSSFKNVHCGHVKVLEDSTRIAGALPPISEGVGSRSEKNGKLKSDKLYCLDMDGVSAGRAEPRMPLPPPFTDAAPFAKPITPLPFVHLLLMLPSAGSCSRSGSLRSMDGHGVLRVRFNRPCAGWPLPPNTPLPLSTSLLSLLLLNRSRDGPNGSDGGMGGRSTTASNGVEEGPAKERDRLPSSTMLPARGVGAVGRVAAVNDGTVATGGAPPAASALATYSARACSVLGFSRARSKSTAVLLTSTASTSRSIMMLMMCGMQCGGKCVICSDKRRFSRTLNRRGSS